MFMKYIKLFEQEWWETEGEPNIEDSVRTQEFKIRDKVVILNNPIGSFMPDIGLVGTIREISEPFPDLGWNQYTYGIESTAGFWPYREGDFRKAKEDEIARGRANP